MENLNTSIAYLLDNALIGDIFNGEWYVCEFLYYIHIHIHTNVKI